MSKINQEIAGKIVKENKDKAQVFVFTHSHIFMTNLIRILESYVKYFQLTRKDLTAEFIHKNDVAGYFDTFFLMVFKDIYNFANEINYLLSCIPLNYYSLVLYSFSF